MNSYKEKLIEDWLTKAGERGGIDIAFGQYLISQGHEILWLGHSPSENGKDISTIAPDGSLHAFQIKDEDLSLKEFRKIMPQVMELIEIPIVHPRVKAGSKHTPHLITSGKTKETVSQQVAALNSKLRRQRKPALQMVDRFGLIKRFVDMSLGFWPDRPEDVRRLLGFYLSDGLGGFDPKSFAVFIEDRLQSGSRNETKNRSLQRISAANIFTSIALAPFEEKLDHWSLFQGWMINAAGILRQSKKNKLKDRAWKTTFEFTLNRAKHHLVSLAKEGACEDAMRPAGFELEDYTGMRNLKVCSCLAAVSLIGEADAIGGQDAIDGLIMKASSGGAFKYLCEAQTSQIALLAWGVKSSDARNTTNDILKTVTAAIAERNRAGSNEPSIPDPYLSEDDVLHELLTRDAATPQGAQSSWTLECLVLMLAARDERSFLKETWGNISQTSLSHFAPENPLDILCWNCTRGTELDAKFREKESYSALLKLSNSPKHKTPECLSSGGLAFSVMFILAFPHRFSWCNVHHIDKYARSR